MRKNNINYNQVLYFHAEKANHDNGVEKHSGRGTKPKEIPSLAACPKPNT